MTDSKAHWENVYATKTSGQVSWTQEVPHTSLKFINGFEVPKYAPIIDIGGGDSRLVDHLLQEGYTDITVLDISANAIDRAKSRLGAEARKVNWIVSDITTFKPQRKYAVWHDRATFHFLTTAPQIHTYLNAARGATAGYLTIGTFSDNGPEKCSGLQIKQYNEAQLQQQLDEGFKKLLCITEDHITPFNTIQNFLFCSFKRVAYPA